MIIFPPLFKNCITFAIQNKLLSFLRRRLSVEHVVVSAKQCDQTGRNPAHLGGFQHFGAGKIFGGAVGGWGGLLHKMRK